MKKNKEWLRNEVNELPLRFLGFSMLKQREEFTVSKDDVLELIDQLDEPEVNSQIDKLANFIMSEVEGEPSQNQGAVDTAIRIIKSYQNQEVLSPDWIDSNSVYASADGVTEEYVHVDDLQNLLVPKQEEQSTETVADVVSTFWKSFERLKEVMSMEVEELEE